MGNKEQTNFGMVKEGMTGLKKESRPHNSGLAKGGIWCFYERKVLNTSFVLPMKFSAEKPALRQAAKR
jgi:hypothetical protein